MKILSPVKLILLIPFFLGLFLFSGPYTLLALDTGGVAVESVSLVNPLLSINSIEGLLVAILNIVIILMIPIIVFFIILAGFKYVTARGNATTVEEATRALTYAILGGILILGAVTISGIIKNVVLSF
jgi:hypothetical protein